MRAVLDTVILVRSLLDPFGWSGTITFDRANEYEAIVSTAIVAEYLDVLNRPTLNRRFRASATRDLDAVLSFIDRATVVHPSQTARICRDPEDDKFLVAAQTGRAAYIVSEDLDLLDLGSSEGIGIVSGRAFLQDSRPKQRLNYLVSCLRLPPAPSGPDAPPKSRTPR